MGGATAVAEPPAENSPAIDPATANPKEVSDADAAAFGRMVLANPGFLNGLNQSPALQNQAMGMMIEDPYPGQPIPPICQVPKGWKVQLHSDGHATAERVSVDHDPDLRAKVLKRMDKLVTENVPTKEYPGRPPIKAIRVNAKWRDLFSHQYTWEPPKNCYESQTNPIPVIDTDEAWFKDKPSPFGADGPKCDIETAVANG